MRVFSSFAAAINIRPLSLSLTYQLYGQETSIFSSPKMQLVYFGSQHTVKVLWPSYKALKNGVYNRNSDTV